MPSARQISTHWGPANGLAWLAAGFASWELNRGSLDDRRALVRGAPLVIRIWPVSVNFHVMATVFGCPVHHTLHRRAPRACWSVATLVIMPSMFSKRSVCERCFFAVKCTRDSVRSPHTVCFPGPCNRYIVLYFVLPARVHGTAAQTSRVLRSSSPRCSRAMSEPGQVLERSCYPASVTPRRIGICDLSVPQL